MGADWYLNKEVLETPPPDREGRRNVLLGVIGGLIATAIAALWGVGLRIVGIHDQAVVIRLTLLVSPVAGILGALVIHKSNLVALVKLQSRLLVGLAAAVI